MVPVVVTKKDKMTSFKLKSNLQYYLYVLNAMFLSSIVDELNEIVFIFQQIRILYLEGLTWKN